MHSNLIFIILICVSCAYCENVKSDLQVINSTIEKSSSIMLETSFPDPGENLLIQIKKLISLFSQESRTRHPDDGIRRKDRQQFKQLLPVLPDFPPFFETIRSYFKLAYKSYLLLNPEVKFGQCIVKYLYTEYPAVMRFFRTQNISNFFRRMYIVMGKFMNNIINGKIFNWSETEFDMKRIGVKVALTSYENPRNINQAYGYPQLIVNYKNNTEPNQLYMYGRRFVRQAQPIYPNAGRDAVKNTGPSKENAMHYEDIDSEARIDLTNRDVEREAENLFNIDAMFWRSLGIEENSFKRYSLAYCTKEYLTESFKRFMKNVILS